MGHRINGRGRKERPVRRLTDGMKKAIVYLVCVSLIETGMLSLSALAEEYDGNSDSGNVTVCMYNDGSAETASNAVRPGGSSGGSGAAGVDPIVTADAVESASNAKKTFETVTYQEYADGITVSVEVSEGALPEGAELVVERYAAGSDEFAEAAEAIGREADDEKMAAVDIHFELDGEEIEPSEEVIVSIDVSEILPEEVDPASIVVTHLEEIDSEEDVAEEDEKEIESLENNAEEDKESDIEELSLGKAKKEVKPVVVANGKKGEIDKENAVVTFMVKRFSTFTVEWNDGTGASITVHVYNINGTSIDEELDEFGYSGTDGVISIADLVSHLEQNAGYASTYTFVYATVYWEVKNGQGGFDFDTIGDENSSVTQIRKSGTRYAVTYGTKNLAMLNNPYMVAIHLYYSLPMVTLTATENTDGSIGFTTEFSYFTGDTTEAEYYWALSDDAYGSMTPDENGTAIFTWSEDAVAGDQVSVTVTMTVGEETASDTYTLTYGTENTAITVTYDLQIAKSLEGVPDHVTSVETFEFTLQELSSISDSTDYTEAVWDTVNNVLGEAESETIGDWSKENDGTWSATADFENFLEYEADEGTTLFYYVLSEKNAETAIAKVQYYGIKVSVEYSSATGIATVTASYCELVETDDEGVYNRNSGWTGLTAYTEEDDTGEYTYFSVPFINTYIAAGIELPNTGGPGTHGSYMIGLSLTGSSLCLFMFLRRRRRWEDGNRGT